MLPLLLPTNFPLPPAVVQVHAPVITIMSMPLVVLLLLAYLPCSALLNRAGQVAHPDADLVSQP